MSHSSWEQIIDEFELEFAEGRNPDVLEYSKRATDNQSRLLEELVHADLELRICKGYQARVEDYCKRFPQIANNEPLVEDLINTEYRIRSILEPGLTAEKFFTRLPDFYGRLRTKLSHVESPGNQAADDQKHVDSDNYSDLTSRFRKVDMHRHGGLGDVWLAQDRELKRTVAVKQIKPRFRNSSAHRSRFTREINITSGLQHPGIVPIYGLGEVDGGNPYFAMQFIDGETLTSVIDDVHRRSIEAGQLQELEFRRLIQNFLDVCQTVHYAHQEKIVHRDLKPDNIMIGKFGETYVVDWGLSKKLGEESLDFESQLNLPIEMHGEDLDGSRDGEQIGSPGFMSPEQLEGRQVEVDSRSDIYSLGCVLFSILKNENQTFQLPTRYQPLISIARKAMAQLPEDRYLSAVDLATDIENCLLDSATTAHEESFSERLGRFSRKNRGILNTALIALTLLSVISLVSVLLVSQSRNRAIEAKSAESLERSKVELALREKQAAMLLTEKSLQLEQEARALAEKRTMELTKAIQIFADSFTNTSHIGIEDHLSEIPLGEAWKSLVRKISKIENPIIQCFVHVVEAKLFGLKKDFKNSVIEMDKVIALLQNDQVPNSNEFYVELISHQARFQYVVKNYPESERLVDLVIEILRHGPDEVPSIQYLNILISKSANLQTRGALEENVNVLRQVLEIAERHYPKAAKEYFSLTARRGLADSYRGLKRRSEELEVLKEIVSSFPEDGNDSWDRLVFSTQLADSYAKNKNLDSARLLATSLVKKIENFEPRNIQYWLNLKVTLASAFMKCRQLEDYQHAIEILEPCRKQMVSEIGPVNEETLKVSFLLCTAYSRAGEKENGERIIEIAHETLQSVYARVSETEKVSEFVPWLAAGTLAYSYVRQGKIKEARDAIEECIEFAIKVEGETSEAVKSLRIKLKSTNKTDAQSK